MKRPQKDDVAPIGEATVVKGQRSMILIVSVVERFAGDRSAFKRSVIVGRNVPRNVF